jgi:hypothetical protein
MTGEPPAGTAGWPPPALNAAGPFAEPLVTLSWVLFAFGVAVFVVVMIALGLAVFGPRRWRQRLGRERLVWVGGFAFPVVVLSALLVYGLALTGRLSDDPAAGEMRVRVTGEMWWWRVAYLGPDGREVLQDANEVHIPTGQPVVFELLSADVIHSFWVPQLGGKKDMIPGRKKHPAFAGRQARNLWRPVRRILRRPARLDGAGRGRPTSRRHMKPGGRARRSRPLRRSVAAPRCSRPLAAAHATPFAEPPSTALRGRT